MLQVVFVCLGNICRSPLAEAIFLSKISNDCELSKIKVSSAATSDWNLGDLADHRSVQVALKYQYTTIKEHRAKVLNSTLSHTTLLICMDNSNIANVKKMIKSANCSVHLFSDFGLEKGTEVLDPYYGELQDFEEVLKQCERYSDEFIEYLKSDEFVRIN